MAIEIERRFLVRDPGAALNSAVRSYRIRQGYFGCIDMMRVRVRIVYSAENGSRGFLTFKGIRQGLCRLEFEYPLALFRARRALNTLPLAHIVQKIRYEVPFDGLVWTLDRFTGLFLAEIELTHPAQAIQLPPWIGKEVTFDPRYCNSSLARSPMPLRHLIAA